VKPQAKAESKAEDWQIATNEAREYCKVTGVYTDGSMHEDGKVGAGWYVEGEKKFGGVGTVATVWDGEVCGMRGALEDAPSGSNVLSLSDSQTAIAAVKKAERTGKARTADLRRVMMDVKERQSRLGPNAVSLGWMNAHNGVHGNEMADQLAKSATEEPECP